MTSYLVEDIKTASLYRFGTRFIIILSEDPKQTKCEETVIDFISSVIIFWDNRADIFLELPIDRKKSEYVQWLTENIPITRFLTKYYDHAYVQSWLQHLYSKDFDYSKLGRYFTKDYDHGLNSFYKKVKSCVYKKSKYDKNCPYPYNLENVNVDVVDVTDQNFEKEDRGAKQFLFYVRNNTKIASYSIKKKISEVEKMNLKIHAVNFSNSPLFYFDRLFRKFEIEIKGKSYEQKLYSKVEKLKEENYKEFKAHYKKMFENNRNWKSERDEDFIKLAKILENFSTLAIHAYTIAKVLQSKNNCIIYAKHWEKKYYTDIFTEELATVEKGDKDCIDLMKFGDILLQNTNSMREQEKDYMFEQIRLYQNSGWSKQDIFKYGKIPENVYHEYLTRKPKNQGGLRWPPI